jgi:hypothetical protein
VIVSEDMDKTSVLRNFMMPEISCLSQRRNIQEKLEYTYVSAYISPEGSYAGIWHSMCNII